MSGLAERLGYEYKDSGPVRASVVRVASLKPMSALASRLLPILDRWWLRTTDGRTTATAALSGLPVVWVTTTGAKSGQKRKVPLLGIPVDGTLALIGTGFGQKATPAWVFNLRANPSALIEYQGREVPVTARSAHTEELDRIWANAVTVSPGFGKYPVWASHREISVFVLES